ncbi:hypothetical protein FGO68_gene15117 [Halteria grandinella]|uniref:Uncharacterized protein n=1 Tax=Halteria grandinella TaxID=5974 RepID=A0A8J8NBH3_HALGN|nr:hypothetical protein FGO68_gene15117 [Halteria grandinella]
MVRTQVIGQVNWKVQMYQLIFRENQWIADTPGKIKNELWIQESRVPQFFRRLLKCVKILPESGQMLPVLLFMFMPGMN